MPFTALHPAAVLPFVRAPLVPSALVIGAAAARVVETLNGFGWRTREPSP